VTNPRPPSVRYTWIAVERAHPSNALAILQSPGTAGAPPVSILEEPEDALVVSAARSPDAIVEEIVRAHALDGNGDESKSTVL
jgi:hypothetical protein